MEVTTAAAEGSAPSAFLSKTYAIVDDPSTDEVVSWGPKDNTFVVWNPSEFAKNVLPRHFKHTNFCTFIRQLNTYGFIKVDPDRWEFANESFARGKKHLLGDINRRKHSSQSQVSQQDEHQAPSPPKGGVDEVCTELGKISIDKDVNRLKRDNIIVVKELIRLHQQQLSASTHLQDMSGRLRGMEQRQQMMISFLAKAMNNTEFLSHLSNTSHKKRRIPADTAELEDEDVPATTSHREGQIVRYRRHTDEKHPESPTTESEISEDSMSGSTDEIPDAQLNEHEGRQAAEMQQSESVAAEVDIGLLINESSNLVGMKDAYWGQFFRDIPVTGTAEDIDISIYEKIKSIRPELQASWERARTLDGLPEQVSRSPASN